MSKTGSSRIGKEIILIILIFVNSSCYFAIGRRKAADTDELPGQLKGSLGQEEKLIDYAKNGKEIYTLISRKGNPDYGDLFVVFSQEPDGGLKRCYENDFIDLRPWKIQVSDIDGEGGKEILVAVKKTTLFDDKIRNRMFIFNYNKGILVKKWTGSQIAGNWRNFTTGELFPMKGNELAFIELDEGTGRERVSIYSWFDFGFILTAQSEYYPEIKSISILKEERIQIISKGKKRKNTIILNVKDGRLVKCD